MNKFYTKKQIARTFITGILLVSGLLVSNRSLAQVPTCGTDVPFYQIDLTGHPDSIWYSPGHSRNGNCCGTSSPTRCTSFEILLDTGAAMINFNIASGAIPTGVMFYQIGCGPQIPVGQPICVVGAGPHHLTFCKPGNNQNTYFVQSIPKPTFPKTQHVRIGCHEVIKVLGLDTPSVTWTSVYPGTTGQYNSYLSCTSGGCVSPVYTPAFNAPPYIDYKICGTPIATACGYVAVCDTVRIYNEPELTGSVTPNPAGFCASGSGVLLTASGSGGYGAYTYIWRDQTNTIVGTGSTYNATAAGILSVEIRDALYNSSSCPSVLISVPVTVTNVPVVDAGPDQTICAGTPTAYLNGSVSYATGAVWTGGAGTFNPGNTNLNASYTPTAGELASGIVTLTLTSTGAGGGCTNATDVVVLHYPPLLTVTLPSTTVTCNSSLAILSPTVSGGSPPYTYMWNTNSGSSSIMVGQGNYCVGITDNIGCIANVCANVVAPPVLSLSMSSTNVSVNGGSNGTATANASGGSGTYTYNWVSIGQTTQTATGLSYGVYTVTVTDGNGCSISGSIVVNEPRCASFGGTVGKNDVICYGNTNGTATVTPSGGTSPYTYSWNDPAHQTTATASGLSAGTYMVVVTDLNGCLYSASVTVTEPTQLTNVMNQVNTTSIGGTDGSATANPFGGTPTYNYSWSNGGATQTIGSLSAGTYILDLSDNNNCHMIDSVMITDPVCNNLTISASTSNVSCSGGNDGSATIVALHGNPPYTYSWSNGNTTSTVNNLIAGTYVVTVTDALNCSAFKNVTITQAPLLSIALAPTTVRCSNSTDGTIELTISGGTFPYNFNWSNGLTVEDLNNLPGGNYSVTVTDAKGCTATGSTSITIPPQLNLTSTSTSVTCNGGSNGSININPTGGVLPYSYAWSNGSTSQNISGLSSGQYSVVVTDANGCDVNIPLGILIDQPEPVAALSYTISCPAPGSGVALVSVTPGGGSMSSYQVSFDNGSTFQTAGDYDALLPVNATYTISVKDNNDCLSPVPLTFSINPEPAISLTTFSKCYYGATTAGTVTITPTGGNSGPYSVSLDGGITYSPAGTYTFSIPVDSSYNVVIKDGDACTSLSSTVSLPAVLANTYTVSSYNGYNVSCNGSSNGTITLTTSGGTQPYSYTWSNSSTTQDQSGITAGNYSVIVTDANSCADTLHLVLNEPSALTSSVTATTDYNGYNISCNGLLDGGINLTVNGGVPAYSYAWSNATSSQDPSSVGAGTYSVVITDLNNCTDTAQITLTEPADLVSTLVSLSNYNGYNISCNGLADGSIDINVTGGVTTYSYTWSNSTSTQDQTNIGAGTYSVVIADANNCKDTLSFTLTEASPLTSSITANSDYNGYNISCFGLSDGSVSLTVNGGVTSYSYNWSNGSTSQNLSSIGAGTYSVVVTDANNCTSSSQITLTQPTDLVSTLIALSNYNGYNISCNGSTDGSIDINVTGGVTTYSYAWSNGTSTQDQTSIGAGTYSVVIADANNCKDTMNFTLNQSAPLTSSLTATSNYNGYNISCAGSNDGAISLSVSGGVTTYSYNWSNGSTSQNLSSIGAGTYSVVVTDANNCTSTAQLILTEPAALTSTVVSQSNYNGYNISCNGLTDGSIDINITGGVTSYSYTWSNGTSTQDQTNIGAGTYSVVITDANNCQTTLSTVLIEPTVLSSTGNVASNYNGYSVSCYGSLNGVINTNASGGVPAYVYTWSNGSLSQNQTGIGAGSYTVVITDQNSCSTTMQFTLNQPDSISVTAAIQNVPCNGFHNGSIDLTVSGGVNPILYNWSNGATSQDISGIGAGAYTVALVDANNCSSTHVYNVTELTPIIINLTHTDVTCYNQQNGSITSVVTGGTSHYQYQWSNGSTQAQLTNLTPGTYILTVTDNYTCTRKDTAIVTEPNLLTVTLSSPLMSNGHNVSFYHSADGSITTTVSGGTAPYTFNWSNGATTQNLSNIPAGTYTVVVTDKNGCTATAQITLTEPLQLEMPTGISPNGDGLNDYFVVHGIEAYPNNNINVFNRWGNNVYEKDNYANMWAGKSKAGADLPDGTYFVILKINNGDITLTGYVDIRR